MSSSGRAVLGFERPDGGIGFCCTSAPIIYLVRLQDGTYRSQWLSADATLRWAVGTESHDERIRRRERLNASERREAISLADRLGAPSATILALRALAVQARTDDSLAIHERAWRLLEAATEAVEVVDDSGELDEFADDDDEPEPL